ncbi:MAG: gliding motility associated protein GldN [Parvicella sp.]|jgi:gliding motility associated protien GldN
MKNQIIYSVLQIVLASSAIAQLPPGTGVSPSGVLNGVYVKEHNPTKRVIQYTHLGEGDVMWSKRVWRTIDLREKMNHQLYYPLEATTERMSLYDVIRYAALSEGTLTLYDVGASQDDQFKSPIIRKVGETDGEFDLRKNSLFGEVIMVDSLDEDGEPVYDEDGFPLLTEEVSPYISAEIIKYEIKEDWFFDKQKGTMDVRIIGISPVVYFKDVEGNIIAEKNLFWLYFPECRYVFQNFNVFNDKNDSQQMSFDDLFWKRDFSSIIHKKSNSYDRTISPTWVGLDALLESEKVGKEIFDLEQNIWSY